MAKSKGRLLAELLAADGKVKEEKSALDITGGKLAPADIPTLPNSKLENSSITIAGESISLGGSVALNTGHITEHTNFKYHTESRVRSAISASKGGGHGSISYNSSTGAITVTGVSTEEIQDVVGAMFTNNTESGITVTYDDSDGTIDLSVAALSTSSVSEGSNLYHTTARARAAISATGSLSYNSSTGVMSFTMPGQNTSNITEGSNLYYTDARADARIAAADTGDLSEGSNLYHTTARARAAISATGSLSYNSSTGVMSFTMPAQNTSNITEGSNLYFTNTRADARIANASLLPLAGGTLTGTLNGTSASFSGNIAVTGTVDGRDVATDGTKLDTIATNANYITNNNQLTNGAGYLLQGSNAVGNGSFSDTIGAGFRFQRVTGGSNRFTTSHHNVLQIPNTSGDQYLAQMGFGTGTTRLGWRSKDTSFGSWYEIWHSGNDGAGSALDADLLDGQHGSYYLNYNNFSNTPSIPSLSGYATESYVNTQVSNLVDSAPGTLNTLNELAAALGDDANFSTTVTTSIAAKLPLAGGTMTGAINMGSQNISAINNATAVSFLSTNGYWVGGIQRMNGTGNLLNIGTITSAAAGTILDASHNLTNINNVYASGYRIGSTTVIDSSRNITSADIHIKSGSSGTNTQGLLFTLPDNADAQAYIKKTAYYMHYNAHYSEGHRFTVNGTDDMLRMHGSNNGTRPDSIDILAGNGLYMNNTQVMTQARALTNVTGNISMFTNDSGYITSADGGNAQTLDGIDSASFLRSDAQDSGGPSAANYLNIQYLYNNKLLIGNATSAFTDAYNDSPWYGIGRTNVAGYNGAGYNKAQIAFYWGLTLRSAQSRIELSPASNGPINFGDGGTSNWAKINSAGIYQGTSNLVWHTGNDGSGSGLDADTVDGINGASFLRSDAADTATGLINFNNRVNIANSVARPAALNSDSVAQARIGGSDVYLYVASLNASGGYAVALQAARASDFASFNLNLQSNGGGLQRAGNTVWDAGNDGSGSGLDADLLDGQHASAFAPIGGSTGRFVTGGLYGTGHGSSILPIWQYNAGNPGYGIGYEESSPDRLRMDVTNNLMSGTPDFELIPNELRINGNKVWNAGNDGSGSGLDADTVDSLHAASFLRSDASDNYTSGTLTFNSGTGFDLATGDVYGSMRVIRNNKASSDGMYIGYLNSNSGATRIFGGGQGSGGIRISGSGNNDIVMGSSSGTAWHSANDGSGSGLDADLLDGQHGSYYYPASNPNGYTNDQTAAEILTAIKTVDGAGSGLDADTIDGHSRINHLGVGEKIDISVGGDAATYYPVVISGGGNAEVSTFQIYRGYNETAPAAWGSSTHMGGLSFKYSIVGSSGWGGYPTSIRVEEFGEIYRRILGGIAFTAHTMKHVVWLRGGTATYHIYSTSDISVEVNDSTSASNYVSASPHKWYSYDHSNNAYDVTVSERTATEANTGITNEIYPKMSVSYNSAGTPSVYGVGTSDFAHKFWNSSNDGSGSGLDADTVDGYHVGDSSNNTANRLVITEGNGYISSNYFYTSSNDNGTTTISRIYASQDGYIRYYTPANFGSQISQHINYNNIANKPTIPTNNNQLTNGAGYITGNQTITLSGHAVGSGTTSIPVTVEYVDSKLDANNVNLNNPPNFPASGSRGVVGFYNAYFPTGSGNISNYNAPLDGGQHYHMQQFNGYSATDGSWSYQIAHSFYNSGMFHRNQNNGTWQAWRTLWDSLNDGSGSGLDADLLDGQHGSYYLPTTGKAADSHLLDGLDSVVFNRGTSSHGVFPATSGYNLNDVFTSFPRAGFLDAWAGTNFPTAATHIQGIQVRHATTSHYGWQLVGQYNQAQLWHRYVSNGSWSNWQQIWSSLTDGSGSGLDADTVDGVHASSFLTGNQTITLSGAVTGSGTTSISTQNLYQTAVTFGGSNGASPDGVMEYQQTPSLSDTKLAPDGNWNQAIRMGHGDPYNYYSSTLSMQMTGTGAGKLRTQLISAGTAQGWRTVWDSVTDGSGSGLDADLLDGRHLSQIARFQSSSDFADGTLVTTDINSGGQNGDSFVIEVTGKAYGGSRPHSIIAEGYLYNNTIINTNGTNISGSNFTYLKVMNISGNLCFWWPRHSYWNSYDVHVRSSSGGTANYNRVTAIANSTDPSSGTKKIQINLATSWTSSNDGASSGLDADLLDGQQGSYYAPVSSIPTTLPANGGNSDTVDNLHAASFLRSDASDSFTGQLTMSTQKALIASNYGHGVYGVYASTRHQHVWSMGTGYNLAADGTSVGNLYGISYTHTNVGTGYGANSAAGLGHQLNGRANGTLQWALGDGAYFTGTVQRSGHTMWDAGNDGSGSGLDADTVDGLNVHNTQSTQNSANQILRTQVNGYSMLGWINTTSGATSSTLNRIYCSQDGYIRYQTPANFGVSIAPHIPHNDSNAVLQTKTLRVAAQNLSLMAGSGSKQTLHTATNKFVVVEEMTMFFDTPSGNVSTPKFSSGPGIHSGNLVCSLFSEWSGGNHRDGALSLKANEVNQPFGATNYKKFFKATFRDTLATDSDTQRQVIPGNITSWTTKVQVHITQNLTAQAAGSWYIYIQVKFREYDVQTELRNITPDVTL